MKKLILFILLFVTLKVSAQQTYWTPGVPPGSTSFTPSFRFKAGASDSLNNLYIANGNKWYQVYTAAQANARFTGGGGGIYLPLTLTSNTTVSLAGHTLGFDADMQINGVNIGRGGNGTQTANTVLGAYALENTVGVGLGGYQNTAIGTFALQATTTGPNNTAVGYNTITTNTTGQNNTALGSAIMPTSTGSDNTGIGYAALNNLGSGGTNTAIGENSGGTLSTGSGNVFLGYSAGLFETGSNTLYISNSSTTTPLIKGNFSTPSVTVNGAFNATGSINGINFTTGGGTTTFLNANGTYSTPSGGVAWGAITGTLSAQTDLNTALNGKQASITTGSTSQYFRGDLSLATFPTIPTASNYVANGTGLQSSSNYHISGTGKQTSSNGTISIGGTNSDFDMTNISGDTFNIHLDNSTDVLSLNANTQLQFNAGTVVFNGGLSSNGDATISDQNFLQVSNTITPTSSITTTGTTYLINAPTAGPGPQILIFTGSTSQSVQLPSPIAGGSCGSCALVPNLGPSIGGQTYTINNNSSGTLTVVADDNSTVQVMAPGTSLQVLYNGTAGYTNASWNIIYYTGGSGGGITALTGDVTASGSGSVAATVAQINGITKSYYDPTSSIQTQLNGKAATISGTGYSKWSGSTPSFNATIPNADLTNSTISGVALGSNLAALSAGNGLTFSNYTGAGVITAKLDTAIAQTVLNLKPLGSTYWLLKTATTLPSSFTTSSLTSFGSSPTLNTAVLTGLPTGTGVSNTSSASTLAARDANGNISANSFQQGFTTIVSSSTPIVLTAASPQLIEITGSTAQTITLPVTGTIPVGWEVKITSASSATITVQSSGGNTVASLLNGNTGIIWNVLATGTGLASWDRMLGSGSFTGSSGSMVLANAPTFTGTAQFSGITVSGFTQVATIATSNNTLASNFVANGGNSIASATTQASLLFGSASTVQWRSNFSGATSTALTANNSYANVIVGGSPVTVPNASTSLWLANEAITPMGTITLTGTGAATNTTTLFVGAASSIGTNKYTAYFDTGNLQIANGNLTFASIGNGVAIKEGTNATMGVGTLSGGTLVISNTRVTANSRIFLTDQGGTVTNLGSLYISARSAGTSFTVNSSNVLDASTFAWVIIEPAP